MKKYVLCTIISICLLAGCASRKNESKEIVQQRWSEARISLMTSMANQQIENEQFDKARKTIHSALESNPNHPECLLILGKIDLATNRSESALTNLHNCIIASPRYAQAYYQLGVTYEKTGNRPLALDAYKTAWELDPDSSVFMLSVIEVLVDTNKKTKALSILNQQIGINKADSATYMMTGSILSSIGKSKEAVKMYRKAIIKDPGNRILKEALAFELLESSQPLEASKMLNQLMLQDEVDGGKSVTKYQLALGDCYFLMKQNHKALRAFQYVSERESRNPAIWTRIGKVYLEKKEYSKAKDITRKALAINPDEIDALFIKAFIEKHNKDYSEAKKSLNKILSINPRSTLAYCLLSKMHIEQGDLISANNCINKALVINPDDKLALKLNIALSDSRIKNK